MSDSYKIRMSPEALAAIAQLQGCTVEVGEPDADGFVNPTFTQVTHTDRAYTTEEVSVAIVRIYNVALTMHAAGETSHNECLGAKAALVAVLELLEIEYRFEPQEGRAAGAVLEQEEPQRPGPLPDTEGPVGG